MTAPQRSASAHLTFVTGNAGKVRELSAMLAPAGIAVRQDDRGYPEIQADTLEEVARAGAAHLLASGLVPPFILEDSGLFVSALRGFPGVYSRHALDTIGNAGLLRLLRETEEELRQAHFETCVLLCDAAGTLHTFTGRCTGRIVHRAAGDGGFGFDPIFAPDDQPRPVVGRKKPPVPEAKSGPSLGRRGVPDDALRTPLTFAEMGLSDKAAVSHRGKAVRLLVEHLEKSAKT